MDKNSKIYIAGHNGLVGSALVRILRENGYQNLVLKNRQELDLTSNSQVKDFFEKEKPEYVFLAAAKVGGIMANKSYPADFIRDNLLIQTNIIDESYRNKVKKLLFLGSSCIYPKNAPQPIKEEYLMTGKLEETNEAYAIAKITGITMCQSYNRQYGTNFISVMPTNLYGINDNFDRESSHVLPAMIRKFEDAKNKREEKMVAKRKVKKKGIPSRNAFHYFIIMFYREELIACAMDLNSSSDNFSFGFENNISDSF
jgi:GDP-L-fucose synthase